MAHFAQLDENNTVTQVIVVHNNELIVDGVESEQNGISFCKSIYGQSTNWKQTSYNGTFRKNFAGIGYTYDAQRDAFIPPKPFASWVLDGDTCLWKAPLPMPTDGGLYVWSETNLAWELAPT